MRVIIWSTVFTKTPPSNYGGIEYIAYILAKELGKRGIETYVIGSQDSPDPATVNGKYTLVKTLPVGHGEHSLFDVVRDQVFIPKLIPIDDETVIVDMSHEKWSYMLKLLPQFKNLHIMSSVHDSIPFLTPPPVRYPCMAGISNQQSLTLSKQLGIHLETVYNGVEESAYPLSTEPREDYMLFLSRITQQKGCHESIHIANQSRTPLIIAGNDSPMFCDQRYVHDIISKSDGKFIQYLGEVSQQKKVELMQKAKCVLLPVLWPEPFGLVAVESMLTGCPVISLANGAYPETIINGQGGFVCGSIDEMIKKTYEVDDLKSQDVRENGLMFGSDKMAERYISLMQQCIKNPW